MWKERKRWWEIGRGLRASIGGEYVDRSKSTRSATVLFLLLAKVQRTLDVLSEHVTRSRPDTERVRHVVGLL